MPSLPEPLQYTLRFPAPQTHYVEVALVIPVLHRPFVDVRMAVWTPGSYLVREYARHVEGLAAQTPDGVALGIEKIRKNRWRIAVPAATPLHVTYKVYCREMSVRTNWIDADFALLNGAPTFLTLVEDERRPHDIRLLLPASWHTTISGLPAAPDGAPHHYRAADFDMLVDSPILAGNPCIYPFEVDGKPHYLVNEGEGGVWDGARSVADVARIVQAHWQMWGGSLPYEQYVFLNMITEAGGGLEHLNSTVLMTSRWNTRKRAAYLDWLGLVSHEYFHVWNVKRLRPIELGPFDYENEVYTRNLWIAEGITSYYTELGVRRAGLCTEEECLAALSRLIQRLQTTPGRLVHALEMASYDAWIKLYRSDENTPNTTISYYTKGAVVAFLLDAHIRQATQDQRCLDDVLRLAYSRHAGERGFTREEFRATAQEIAGTDVQPWFAHTLESTAELDYQEALSWFGLRFKSAPASTSPWLGVETRVENGRLLVTQVKRYTPAWEGGVNVDDELVGIGEYRVRPEQWNYRLGHYQPGERVSLLVARRERLQRLDMTLGTEPANLWQLEIDPAASHEQQQRRQRWLATTVAQE